MILRAKAELGRQRERVAWEAEEKSKGKESHQRMIEEMIQATKKRFVENSNLTSAGPKHVHHFHGFFGDIMHIEIVGTSLVIVFTSRGFIGPCSPFTDLSAKDADTRTYPSIEVWRQDTLTSWKLVDYWHLAPYYPRVTVVTPLTPTPGELAHLMQNRIHYLKPPEELAPPKPESVPPSPPPGNDGDAVDEEEEEEEGDDIAPLPTSGLSGRSDMPPPAPSSISAAAAAAFTMSGGGGRRGPAPPPKDELVQMLTSATYDMGGIVAVSDEQAVRRANYFAFLLAWASSRSAASSAASMLGSNLAAAASPAGPAAVPMDGGSKAGSTSKLADMPQPSKPMAVPVQPQSGTQQQVLDRQLYLIGCANGEVSLLELTIDFSALVSSADASTPSASSSPTRPVRFRILDRAMISVAPILHAVYFAPGHHAAVVVHSRDAHGHLIAELVGYAVPRLKPAFRVALADLVDSAREMADDGGGGSAHMQEENDPYTFGGGGWNGGATQAAAQAAALTVPSSAKGSGALGLTALVADNVQLRMYLGVKDLLVQVAFASLPLITEATFFNTEEEAEGGAGKRRASSASSDDGAGKGGRGAGGGGDDEMLELVVVAAHSVRARAADEDDDADVLGSEVGGSITSNTMAGAAGGLGGLAGSVPEELVEISSLCPITSPYTFKPYLLLGCTDASIRCIPVDDPSQEIFYYSSDIALRGVSAPMTVAALCPFRDAQLALAVCVDGTTSVLSIDRRELLNEHRMLMGRGGVRNAASAAAAATTGAVRGSLANATGSKVTVLPPIGAGPEGASTNSSVPSTPGSPNGRSRAQSAAVHTRSGAGMVKRQVYVGEPDQCLYAVAVANEWALVKVTDLVKWLDANPLGSGVGGMGVGTGPPLL
ncbi:hypothetical protein BCR44DRAFT_38602 [Catenaria anguillulae PL171]|uniref:Uncharacterized protein n=1 Tax=Catenaria anguillulae PL171 TaxID=765915 RepID=A0A1Y2HNZ3_9FUNG|nr:hypothetical protein BCR44DRAFT_38602 [Catenaria anguillulae PL171]